MKKLLCALLVLMMLALPVAVFTAGAESIITDDMLVDLMPDAELDKSIITATDCEVRNNDDGSLVVKVTGSNPTLIVNFAEGSTLQIGSKIDVSQPAFFALDFGTAGSISIDHMIFHYTRKDKAAENKVADLYMESMYSSDYAAYRKQVDKNTFVSTKKYDDGSVNFVVWDWAGYLNAEASKKVFDDKMHHFTQLDLGLKGSTVGSELTFFTMGLVQDENVELGKTQPAPLETSGSTSSSSESSSSASSETSSATSSGTSSAATSSAASSVTSSTSSAASSASSAASNTSSAASGASSAASNASSAASNGSSNTSSAAEDGGSNVGLIVGIIVAVVVVAVIVVVVVVVRKKK